VRRTQAPSRLADRADVHILILCLLPLVLLAANREWIFNPPGFIDSWIYLGFFENYDLPQYFVGEKKILRLPWIWTGFAAYRLFAPTIANYVLHLLALIAPSSVLYFVARRYFAPCIGFFAAVSLLLYIPFHAPGGWDYHDADGAFLYLVTFWLVCIAAEARATDGWIVGAGAAFALTLHANIIFINLTPLLLLQFLTLHGWPSRALLWRMIAAGLAGAVVATLVLCIGNFLVGRPFFFHWILLRRVLVLLTQPEQQVWWRSWQSGWFLGRDGLPLALLVALLASACGLLAKHMRAPAVPCDQRASIALGLQWQLIVAAAIFLFWQLLGQTALQPWYMAEPILYPAMLALAGQLYICTRSRDFGGVWVYAVVPAAYLAMMAGSRQLHLEAALTHLAPVIDDRDIALLPLAFYVAAVIALQAWGARFAGLTIFSLLMVGADAVHLLRAPAYMTIPGVINSRIDAYGYPDDCPLRQDLYLTTLEANRYLTSLEVTPTAIRIWWDDDELLGRLAAPNCRLPSRYVAIPIAASGFSRVANPQEPTIDDVTAPQLSVVVSNDAARMQAILDRMNAPRTGASGMHWSVSGTKMIATPVLRLSMTLLEPHIEILEGAGGRRLTTVFGDYAPSRPRRIRTPPQPWAYGAELVNTAPDLKGPLWIDVEVRVSGGPVGIGVLNAAKTDFSVRRQVDAHRQPQHVTLFVPDNVPLGNLVVESWEEGTAAVVELEKLDVVLPKSTSSQ